MDGKLFGAFIKKRRIKSRIRIVDMAKELGISLSYYSDIENGRRLPPNNPSTQKVFFFKLTSLLDLSEDEVKEMYNAVDHDLYSKGIISPDMASYATENKSARVLFRNIMNENLSEEQLQELNEKIKAIKEGKA